MIRASELSTASIAAHQSLLESRGTSRNTLRGYSSDLRLFLAESGMDVIPLEDYEELAMMWLQMNRRKVAPSTSLRRLSALRNWAKAMTGEDALTEYKGPQTAPGSGHPIPEGIEGIERMLAATDKPEHRALVALGGFCGCRIAESLTVTHEDFDLNKNILRVRGKNDKTRYVPISEKAWEHLAIPVALSMTSFSPLVQLHERYARKVVATLGERAGLSRRVSSHDLRSTFATVLYDKTLDMVLVQRLLGHRSIVTTQIYVGTEMERMRSAVNQL